MKIKKVCRKLFVSFICLYASLFFSNSVSAFDSTIEKMSGAKKEQIHIHVPKAKEIKKETYEQQVRRMYKEMNYLGAIQHVERPGQAQEYLDYHLHVGYDKEVYAWKEDRKGYVYKPDDFWAPFKLIHEKGRDDCDGFAVAAAALLSDNGYSGDILWLYSANPTIKNSHVVYIYKNRTTEKYCAITRLETEKEIGRHGYDTINSLAEALLKAHHNFDSYVTISLPDPKKIDWINGDYFAGLALTGYMHQEFHKAKSLKWVKHGQKSKSDKSN